MPQFGLNGATTGAHVDVTTDIRAAATAGYQCVELRDTKIARYLSSGGSLSSLRALLRQEGVAPLSVNALEDSTLRDRVGFEEVVARQGTLCEWARALECPYVVAVPSMFPSGTTLSETEVRRRSAAALRALIAAADGSSVRLGFEFLGSPSCSVSTLRAARGVVEDVGDPRVGLVIDAFHFYIGGSQPEDLDGIDPSRIFIVHLDDAPAGEPSGLTDAQRLLPGEGIIQLRRLVARLRAAGYAGAYSLELFRPEYWAWDPVELARRGLEAMRRVVA
ncbi:MAG TPA: sugar phosphate isomerase/epimerase [bacterium]|nr:sugar phosphate isomerase/epimerase [bacterium]